MKVAIATLIRNGETSPMVNSTYVEEVRGFSRIEWSPSHVVFYMKDDTIIAYKADRVHELVTHFEDQ